MTAPYPLLPLILDTTTPASHADASVTYASIAGIINVLHAWSGHPTIFRGTVLAIESIIVGHRQHPLSLHNHHLRLLHCQYPIAHEELVLYADEQHEFTAQLPVVALVPSCMTTTMIWTSRGTIPPMQTPQVLLDRNTEDSTKANTEFSP